MSRVESCESLGHVNCGELCELCSVMLSHVSRVDSCELC